MAKKSSGGYGPIAKFEEPDQDARDMPGVDDVQIGASLTDWGGSGASSKAQPNYSMGQALRTDRNIDHGNEGGYRKK